MTIEKKRETMLMQLSHAEQNAFAISNGQDFHWHISNVLWAVVRLARLGSDHRDCAAAALRGFADWIDSQSK